MKQKKSQSEPTDRFDHKAAARVRVSKRTGVGWIDRMAARMEEESEVRAHRLNRIERMHSQFEQGVAA